MILEHEPLAARAYKPPKGQSPKRPAKRRALWGPGRTVGLALGLLVIAAWYAVEQAHLIQFETMPETALVQVDSPSLKFGKQVLLLRGRHVAKVEAEGYHALEKEFEAGDDAPRTVEVQLDPLPGRLLVQTRPNVVGEVWIDGARAGDVGEVLEDVAPGAHAVQVRAKGYETHRQTVEIAGLGRQTDLGVALRKLAVPAFLKITSAPSGADLMIDGAWQGNTPQEITMAPGAKVNIAVLLPGHGAAAARRTLKSGNQTLHLKLKPRSGLLEIATEPANATVRINGKVELQRQVRLPQRPHVIEVSAPDHAPGKYVVVPHPDAPQRLRAVLTSQAQVQYSKRKKYEMDLGMKFIAFRPQGAFEITTTRRRIPIRLTRPFAILDREVTNELFQRFRSTHDSGEVLGVRLNEPGQPVVKVSWADAALFANWLSEQAGVAPFYRVRDGKVVGFDASAFGYRLPSEAEWVWLTGSDRRFAWGDSLPPPNRFGNLADVTAAEVVQPVMESYSDGHVVSASVASFAPNARGLYDLPGNVAEWMHDVFLDKLRISARPETERVNPLGESTGRHYVIRGFGWRDSGRKELSLINRRYDRDARDDVGFRLAYYLEKP